MKNSNAVYNIIATLKKLKLAKREDEQRAFHRLYKRCSG